MNYQEAIDKDRIPQHVAIIMDGNGRWAQARGLQRTEGHVAGVRTVWQITEDAVDLGVKWLTLYTFSTENWNRPQTEVKALMTLLFENAGMDEKFMKNNVRLRVIGDLSRIPMPIRIKLNQLQEKTSRNTRATLVVAVSYSARWEITEAARQLAIEAKEGKIKPDDITEETVSKHLSTSFMPDPELLIRTGGELRLSNFLMWQASYSELYFCDTFWPDFNKEDLCKAIYAYQNRERRFGLTSAQVSETK